MRLPKISSAGNSSGASHADPLVLHGIIGDEALNEYIEYHYGRSLEQLLAPIGDNPVGESVRHNGVYFQIKEARRADDPTLPQGVWTHDLKSADWDIVEKTALDALCNKSKDLQLGVWLMESSIHRKGFAGIAPGAILIRALCESYWETMHPQMLDGDIEFRTNPINWINEKLSLQLRLVPITRADIDGHDLCWDDWDKAQRFEQLKRQQPGEINWDGPGTDTFKQRLAATPKEYLLQLCMDLEDGRLAAEELIAWLDKTCGEYSPSLSEITGLISQVYTMASGELKRRGIKVMAEGEEPESETQSGAPDHAQSGGGQGGGGSGGGEGPLRDRADAFAMLRRAAEFLMNDDPHSPVPYMVYTACEWGEKSAPELYQELFLIKGGQLNIFEVMGLAVGNEREG